MVRQLLFVKSRHLDHWKARQHHQLRLGVNLSVTLLKLILVLLTFPGCQSVTHPRNQQSHLRIVSLSPSVTEMLFSLEAGDMIVGVTDHCDYPPAAKDIERIGGFGAPNIERLLALSPDLVIATGRERASAVAILDRARIPVLWLKTNSISMVLEALLEVGRHVGRQEHSQQLVAAMQSELESIAQQHQQIPSNMRPRVFVEVWNHPITTVGNGSYVGELISRAGGINVAHEINLPYPTVNPEKVVEWNPDTILLMHMNPQEPKEDLSLRIGWRDMTAIRSGKIIDDISPDLLLRPGPRLAQGVRILSRRLHSPVKDLEDSTLHLDNDDLPSLPAG